MAAIFQLRRGTSNATLADGELYLHKGIGSIQFSSGSANPITLLPLNAPVSGNIVLNGNITASNAYFTGDVAISGNLFLGNNTSDNINALGVFTSDIKPGTTNVYNIGTTTGVWANVYANSVSASAFTGSFSGSINGVEFTSFSTSVDSRLDNIQDFTASVTGNVDSVAYFNQSNRITSYNNSFLGATTFGLGTSATSSPAERLMVDSQTLNIATFQTSQQNTYAQLNIKNFGSGSNASTDLVIWNDVATESSSYVDLGINSSNYSAGGVGFGGDGYLINAANDLYVGSMLSGSHGHLHLFAGNLWDSSSISIYSDGTIGINTDKFDTNALSIPTTGYAMEISGNVIFDNNVDFLGNISSSTISGIGNVTTYSASVDSRLDRLSESTQSINDYTQSLKNAIDVTGGNTRIIGNLIVDGTQTSLNTTNVYIEDFKITLASGSATSAAADGAGFEIAGANVSMSWEHSNTKFGINTNLGVQGEISSSTISGLGNATEFASAIQSSTASLNTFSASVNGHISDINTKTGSFENKFTTIQNVTASVNLHTASLNTYTQSVNGHISDLNSWTASQNQKDTIISSVTESYNGFTGSATASMVLLFATASNHEIRIDDLESKATTLQSYTASVNSKFLVIESLTASYNIVTASLNQFTSSTYSNFSTSVDLRLDQLEYTTSILTPEGQAESFNAINGFTGSANNRLNNLELHTGSYATTGSNTFMGNQTVTGSMYISGDLVVQGSSSLQNITASAVSIGTNIVYLNTDTPAVRFAGLSVFDSGSTQATGSLLYDSQNERWVYQKSSGSSYNGGMLISGPRNTGSLGDEIGMPTNKLIMGMGGDHISSSGIYHNGTDTAFGGNLEVTGSTTLGTANITTLNAGNGIVSGSSQVLDILSSLNTYTGSNDTLNTLQTTRIDQLSAGTASVNTFTQSVDGHISDINSYTSSLKTAFSVSGNDVVVSGNLTVLGDAVTLNVGNLSIEDKTIVIASGSTTSILADGAGLYISGADASILWNHANTRLDVNKSIASNANIQANKFVFTDGVINENTSGKKMFATNGNISYLYTGENGLYINNQANTATVVQITDAGQVTIGAPGNDQNLVFGGSNSSIDWAGTGAKIQYSAGALKLSSVGSTDNIILQQNGGALFNFGLTGSIGATNGVISGSSQLNGTTISNLSGSFTGSYTGSFTGSFKGNVAGVADYAQTVAVSSVGTTTDTTLYPTFTTNAIIGSYSSLYSHISASFYYNGVTRQVNAEGFVGGIFATNGVVSGSSQIDATATTNWSTGIKTQLDSNTVVSGSSQITLSSTTGGGTTANVQFGSLGIGTTASGVSGEIRATGDIVAFYSSDERLKENIQPIQNALSKVESISGNTYDWKEGFETIHSHTGHDLGVIAQEVQSVLPEVVTERETGYLAVDYVKLVPVLIEAIKELSAKVKELENK